MEEMIKCIGAIANTAAKEERILKTSEVAEIINKSGFISATGDPYVKVDLFIRQAYEKFSNSDKETASNIKLCFETRAGEPVIK